MFIHVDPYTVVYHTVYSLYEVESVIGKRVDTRNLTGVTGIVCPSDLFLYPSLYGSIYSLVFPMSKTHKFT